MRNNGKETGKPPLTFLRNEKKNFLAMGKKDALNMPCYRCVVKHFVFVFILLCFTAFGSLEILHLTYFSRSSPSEVLLGKGVLKICSKFTGEQPCQSAVSIKLHPTQIHIIFKSTLVRRFGRGFKYF